jgi:hypothetical protein
MLNKLIEQVDVRIVEDSIITENIPQFQASAIREIFREFYEQDHGSEQRCIITASCYLFCNLGHRSQEQKQKAPRLQKGRRQRRRAGITSGRDNSQDKQTAGAVGFVPK